MIFFNPSLQPLVGFINNSHPVAIQKEKGKLKLDFSFKIELKTSAK